MGAVAPVDEKRTLADELAQVRALIEDGDYDAALDRLWTAREVARAQVDTEALREVRGLARLVSKRAPPGSDTVGRADTLVHVVGQELATLPTLEGSRRRGPRGLGLWTLIVLLGWVAVSLIVAEVSYSSDNWLFSEGAYIFFHLVVFGVVALGVWLLGFFVWLARARLAGRHRARPAA